MFHVLGCFRYSVLIVYQSKGIYAAIIFTLIMIYLFFIVIYTHIKAWSTEPGYPERVATATGHLKVTYEKKDMRWMSYNLKSLINKRNKGFVALLNSGLPSFTKFQN